MIDEVYVVSRGEYSDYRVLAAFEDHGDANTYAAARHEGEYGDRNVEILPLVKTGELPAPIEYLQMSLSIVEGTAPGDDEIKETTLLLYPDVSEDDIEPRCAANTWTLPKASYRPVALIMIAVRGTDVERVRKVFNERRAQCRADFDLYVTQKKEFPPNIHE